MSTELVQLVKAFFEAVESKNLEHVITYYA